MKDTDWRPSPCPECGEMREAAKYPVCGNRECRYFAYRGDSVQLQKETRTMKTQKRYLWIRPNSVESPMVLIDDPVELYRGSKFDESTDKLYELGPEVKLTVSVIPAQPVTRENASGYRTTFENRD